MRTVVILLVIAAAVVAALFALGVIGSPVTPTVPSGETPATAPTAPTGTGTTLVAPPPEQQPPIEAYPVGGELHVLLLTRYVERVPASLSQWWGSKPKVKVTAWVEPSPPSSGSGAPPPGALENAHVLDAMPEASIFEGEAIDVLVLDAIDVARFPEAFWVEVAARVHDHRLGLLAIPGRPDGGSMLDNPVLGPLIPVAKSLPLEGSPLPGVLGGMKPFRVTDPGVTHPVSRLVAWPRWSRAIWGVKGTGDKPWGTSQCWPVESVANGAATLLEVSPDRGATLPVLIASDPANGRVLFFGAYELTTRQGYGIPKEVQDLETWLTNWLVWLADRVGT